MLMYYILYALVLGLAWPLCIHRPSRRKALAYLLVTFAYLFFLSAARYDIGNDYDNYIRIYENVKSAANWDELRNSGATEPGFLVLLKAFAVLGLGETGMYAAIALLCLGPVLWFIYRYSPNVWLSVWLYVTLTFFYGTMNFVRQNLALAILLLGYPLLRRRRLWPCLGYVAVVVFAALFHKTALIALPVLLLCYIPLNKWIGGAYTALALLLYATSNQVLDFVTRYIYSSYRDSVYLMQGLLPRFLIIPALMLLIVLCFKKPLEERFEDAPLLVNMMLFAFLIWLFITKHMILERFSLYIYVYVLLIVPMATECLKPADSQIAERDALRRQVRALKGKKSQSAQFKTLNAKYLELCETVRTQYVFYWCLIAAVLVATFIYNVFGMYDQGMKPTGRMGFHGVFPYHSLIGWINLLP